MSDRKMIVLYVEVPDGENPRLLEGLRVTVPGWRRDFRYDVVTVADGEDMIGLFRQGGFSGAFYRDDENDPPQYFAIPSGEE